MTDLWTDAPAAKTASAPAARTRPTRTKAEPADATTATTGHDDDCGIVVVEWISVGGVRLEVFAEPASAAQHRVRMALAALRDAVNDHRLSASIERVADTAKGGR